MSKQNVFLTGASGDIGSALLEVLVATGEFDVWCLTRGGDGATRIAAAGGRTVIGDMADGRLFESLRGERVYDFIVHTAQAGGLGFSETEIDAIDGKAVENLERIRTAVTKLMVYTSGVWIFGHCAPGVTIGDSTPLRPLKNAAGRAVRVAALKKRFEHPWAQLCPPSYVYGATRSLKAIAGGLKSGDIDVLDDDAVLWSVIERLDLGRAYLALLRQGLPGDFFVVAEDLPVRVTEFFETIASHVGCGRVVRKPKGHWLGKIGEAELEVMYASQPVDSTGFKRRTAWRAQETFLSSIGRFVSRSADGDVL